MGYNSRRMGIGYVIDLYGDDDVLIRMLKTEKKYKIIFVYKA